MGRPSAILSPKDHHRSVALDLNDGNPVEAKGDKVNLRQLGIVFGMGKIDVVKNEKASGFQPSLHRHFGFQAGLL
jgi:hypothetical protein